MDQHRFAAITGKYAHLKVAILGDFCLDRYLEIDPVRQETSIETGLPVHNVVNVRAQPGGAGTILNNLSALGVGTIYPVGFAGDDGEGFELWHALEKKPGVCLDYFAWPAPAHTFTYCKPLLMSPGKPPVELNRLDTKNWVPTPGILQDKLINHLQRVAEIVDAIIVLDQVDLPDTGVVTGKVLSALGEIVQANPKLLALADSRRGLRGFPPVIFKMNAAELSALTGMGRDLSVPLVGKAAVALARKNSRPVVVTLSERGLLAASPSGQVEHVAALPLRGEIDVVGAGDAVSANFTAALAAGASLYEAVELANAAASVVVHKLGTTGTCSVPEIAEILLRNVLASN